MIKFHNGYNFDFGCASGAMAFDGKGWWFEQPWRWLKLLRPEEFTIITKTLTFKPHKGNYVWWKPWTCVKLLPDGGVLNRVGLTNPGYEWWLNQIHLEKVIVSIAPENEQEAEIMAAAFNKINIIGLQLNVSCPNTTNTSKVCELVEKIQQITRHPLIVKLGYQDLGVCKELNGKVAAFELINSVPYKVVYGAELHGGVSGKPIAVFARDALKRVKEAGVKTPIISGGGIDSLEEVKARNADGFVFGSIFIRKPWLPNQIIGEYRNIQVAYA